MKNVLDSLRMAVRNGCWHPALALALALPDMCGRVAGVKQGRKRYIDWCTKYLVPTYTVPLGPFQIPTVFMTGQDCYLLRCAYLHAGEFELDDPSEETVLTHFRFVAPQNGLFHRNRINDSLQLQVSEFCEEMAQAVEKFLDDIASDKQAQQRLQNLATIEEMKDGIFRI